jgi:predicted transposase/invertase (TIGR01784 family)
MTNLIRFDWAIKKILRDKANFDILEGFLSELLEQNIKILNLLDSESNKETNDDKFNRVDLLAELENKELVIIEVQNDEEYDYLHRILYGTSKTISENMKRGNPYENVKKVISVSIIYFDLGEGLDYVYKGTTNFIGIHNKDRLILSDDQKMLFNKIEPYEIFPEYYILKVSKFDEITKDGLDEWIYFLKKDEIKEGFKAKGLKEAKEKLDVMKLPPEEQGIYDNYLEDLHLKASLAQTQKFKLEKAQKEGLEEGLKEGALKGALKVAKIMKEEGEPIEKIIKYTGLTKEEINKL